MAQKDRTELAALSESGDVISSAWAQDVYDSNINVKENTTIVGNLRIIQAGSGMYICFNDDEDTIEIRNELGSTMLRIRPGFLHIISNTSEVILDGDGETMNINAGEIGFFGVTPTPQQANIAAIGETAGALYTSNEQDMLNNLAGAVNDIIGTLIDKGLVQAP